MNSIARAIYDVAFIWLVLELTNSERITGLVAMTSYLPAILCGLFIGAIVDLFSKTKMISFKLREGKYKTFKIEFKYC